MRPLDPRLRPLLRPAAPHLWVVTAGSVVAGILTIVQAVLVATFLVRVVTLDDGWLAAGAWLGGVALVRAAAGWAVDTAAARAAATVSDSLRSRLLATPAAGLDAGRLSLLATRGVVAVEPYVVRYLPALVTAAVLPPATVVAILLVDPWSALIVALTLPLVPLFAALVGIATRDRARRQWRLLGALSGHFLDVVRGLPTLVIHRRAHAQAARIGEITDRYRRASSATLRIAFASSLVLELVATLSVALVAVAVGLRLAGGHLPFETALTALLLAPEAYWPLRRVGAEFHAAAEGQAALAEAATALETSPVGVVRELSVPLDRSNPPKVRGLPRREVREVPAVELAALRCGYGDRAVTGVLDAVLAAPGFAAVTGPSGAGKTSLLRTIAGELEPVAGAVAVGGVPWADLDLDGWRRSVAWSTQEPWLLADTIAANLRVGRPDAPAADLWRALEEVGLGEAVATLPDGLESALGEDGTGLSAGQQARLAIARVLVADRPVCLLDEPTARLDAATEAVLLDVLRRLSRQALVVVVSHRPAVLAAADQVLEVASADHQEALPQVSSADDVRSPARRESPTPETPETADSADSADSADHRASAAGRLARGSLPLATLLGALSAGSGVALTATAAWLITRASQHPAVLTLVVAIVAVRAFGIGRPVLRYAERLLSHDTALARLARRRVEVYRALVPLVPGALGPGGAGGRRGELLTSVVDDVDAEVDELLRVRQPLWTAAYVGVAAAGFAWLIAPAAGGVLLALLALTGLAAAGAWSAARAVEPGLVTLRAHLSTQVTEFVQDSESLRRWQRTDAPLAAIEDTSERLGVRGSRLAATVAAARVLVALGGVVGVVAAGALLRQAPVGPALTALLVLLPLALVEVLVPAVDAAALAPRAAAARGRLASLTARRPVVVDPARPAPPPSGAGVDLRAVTLGWQRPVLEGIDLRLLPGARVGVIGPSGSGKSTLAAALVRFLDPRAGAVSLGGTDLRDLRLDDVRTAATLLDHAPYVFASSVVENVRLARPEASDGEVLDALRRAELGDLVDSLPEGIHTLVGEGHRDISGGERARLGLARVLLSDARVVVLDEPTAHLDARTAEALAAQLLALDEEHTLVWVTNGSTGLQHVDEVVDVTRWSHTADPSGRHTGRARTVRRAPRERVAAEVLGRLT